MIMPGISNSFQIYSNLLFISPMKIFCLPCHPLSLFTQVLEALCLLRIFLIKWQYNAMIIILDRVSYIMNIFLHWWSKLYCFPFFFLKFSKRFHSQPPPQVLITREKNQCWFACHLFEICGTFLSSILQSHA